MLAEQVPRGVELAALDQWPVIEDRRACADPGLYSVLAAKDTSVTGNAYSANQRPVIGSLPQLRRCYIARHCARAWRTRIGAVRAIAQNRGSEWVLRVKAEFSLLECGISRSFNCDEYCSSRQWPISARGAEHAAFRPSPGAHVPKCMNGIWRLQRKFYE